MDKNLVNDNKRIIFTLKAIDKITQAIKVFAANPEINDFFEKLKKTAFVLSKNQKITEELSNDFFNLYTLKNSAEFLTYCEAILSKLDETIPENQWKKWRDTKLACLDAIKTAEISLEKEQKEISPYKILAEMLKDLTNSLIDEYLNKKGEINIKKTDKGINLLVLEMQTISEKYPGWKRIINRQIKFINKFKKETSKITEGKIILKKFRDLIVIPILEIIPDEIKKETKVEALITMLSTPELM